MKQIILSVLLDGKIVLVQHSRSLYMLSQDPCHKLRSEASQKDFILFWVMILLILCYGCICLHKTWGPIMQFLPVAQKFLPFLA